MTVKFSPAVLSSEATLDAYMRGKETIDTIKAEAKTSYIKGQGNLGALEVVWIVMTSPLVHACSPFINSIYVHCVLFIGAVGNLCFYCLNAPKMGMKLIVQATHLLHKDIRMLMIAIFNRNLLVSTVNVQSMDKAEEVYTHPAIPVTQIPQPLQNRFRHYIDHKHLHLDKVDGQCAGMSDWFAYLCLQTESVFRNKEQHLVAVASQLKNGAGKEAALWQLGQFDGADGFEHTPPLLGLKKRRVEKIVNPTIEKAIKTFKRLKPGLYALRTQPQRGSGHRMNFYKDAQDSYVFDPNAGLIAFNSDAQLENWVRYSVVNYYLYSSIMDILGRKSKGNSELTFEYISSH